MKLFRNVIILVVVLAILTGSYIFLKNRDQGNSSDDDSNDIIKIFDLELSKIKEMTVETPEGVFEFEKKDEEWTVVSPAGLKADKNEISSIASNIYSLSADKLVEENPADLSIYGLDKPVVVTVKTEDGVTKALEIGDQTPTKSGYYVREKGGDKVYVIGSYTGGRLKITKNSIRDKQLFTVEQDDITALAMERNQQKVFEARKSGETDWLVTYPIDATAQYSAMVPMVEAITQAKVSEFIEENVTDLEKYGLNNPRYILEFEASGSKKKLLLGSEKEKGSQVYAMLDGDNEVFTISLSSFSFLDKPFKEIIESFAHIVSIWDVLKIEVEMDGQKVVSEIDATQEGDGDKFTVNGKDASMEDDRGSQPFRKYYQALIGITLYDIELGVEPTGEPEVTITYHQKVDPKLVKLEFIPKNNRFYYVVKNDKYTGMVVDKAKFDEIRNSYKNLVEVMEKQ
ncbi:MAG TPA: DUF4340 domain-containing protein [Clostridiaceae bacterium]|nr:DUF4340 domain-containing protein [Clostridiaceae bacterium]